MNNTTSVIASRSTKSASLFVFTFSLGLLLCALFVRSFIPSIVLFSNDGPYGGMASQQNELPDPFFGSWNDLNWLGGRNPPVSLGPSAGVRMACWYLTTRTMVLVILGAAAFLYWAYRTGVLLRLTGYGCFATAGGISIAILLHALGSPINLDWLIPFGCLVWLISTILVFSLRSDL